MKSKLLFIFFVVVTFTYGQTINFPDANFKAKLLSANTNNSVASIQTPVHGSTNFIWSVPSTNKIDVNNDGEIQVSEAQSIQWLDVSLATITDLTGIEYFTNLKYLNCKYNSITTLNLTPLVNLQSLNCFSSNVSSINLSGLVNLIDFTCQSNSLNTLDLQGLNNLIRLDCAYNQLTTLEISNLVQLQNFSCSHNQLSTLNLTGLNSIINLSCSFNQLSSLDISNNLILQNLDCSNNQIVNLDVQSLINLKYLTCSSNQITQLNIQDLIYLEDLNCAANQITSLNFNNLVNMQRAKCAANLLTSLDLSNCPNLSRLECMSNQLEFLNIKNGIHSYNLIINNLYFNNNPNLTYICCDESEISTIQISANAYGVNCNIGSYCSFTPNGTYYTIQGSQKFDYNNNGCDANDIVFPNFKYSISSGTTNGVFISNNSGSYNIPLQSGSYVITPILENPAYFNVSPTSFNISFPATPSPYNQDFCLTANGVYNDLEIILLPITLARPGFDSYYKIVFKNKGTTTQTGTINLSFTDATLDLVSASPSISNQSANLLTWNFTNLIPFESRVIDVLFNLNSPTESPSLNNGDVLNFTASINGATDEMPNDNEFILHQAVVNSFDPNDKTCLEGTIITTDNVGEYIHYIIRFENNGTANAENIVVKDMIDTNKFDIDTLIPIQASHNFETRISATNKVEFIFQNIDLPFDDANNDGYLSFKIKTKPNLVIGDAFSNSANIYFDYNFPIVTNNYITTVQNVLELAGNELKDTILFYPNPVVDFINFQDEENYLKIEVYDSLGRIVSSNSVIDNKVSLVDLKKGNYILKIYTEYSIFSAKISKE